MIGDLPSDGPRAGFGVTGRDTDERHPVGVGDSGQPHQGRLPVPLFDPTATGAVMVRSAVAERISRRGVTALSPRSTPPGYSRATARWPGRGLPRPRPSPDPAHRPMRRPAPARMPR